MVQDSGGMVQDSGGRDGPRQRRAGPALSKSEVLGNLLAHWVQKHCLYVR